MKTTKSILGRLSSFSTGKGRVFASLLYQKKSSHAGLKTRFDRSYVDCRLIIDRNCLNYHNRKKGQMNKLHTSSINIFVDASTLAKHERRTHTLTVNAVSSTSASANVCCSCSSRSTSWKTDRQVSKSDGTRDQKLISHHLDVHRLLFPFGRKEFLKLLK